MYLPVIVYYVRIIDKLLLSKAYCSNNHGITGGITTSITTITVITNTNSITTAARNKVIFLYLKLKLCINKIVY